MRSSFTSCVEITPVTKTSLLISTDEYVNTEFGLCECIVVVDEENSTNTQNLYTLSIDQLAKLNIETLKVSDGSDIWEKRQVTIDSLQLFTFVSIPFKQHITKQWFKENNINIEEDLFYRICIWYELIKMLSGNKIFCFQCDNVIKYSKFVCYSNPNSSGNIANCLFFALELHSKNNIVRKMAQFTLDRVQNGEIDLFLLSSRMFESLKQSNSTIKNLLQENEAQRKQIDTFINEKKQLEIILKKRDDMTRSMVINLLNEKKAKIKELESKLSHFQTNQVLDSDLINKYVHNPILQLNSPGRRKRKNTVDFDSPTSSVRKRNYLKIRKDSPLLTKSESSLTNIPSLKHQNNDVVKVKLESDMNDDEFENFDNSKFLGINKTINLDKLDSPNLMESELKTPKIKIKDEIDIKRSYNKDSFFQSKEESNDTSSPYELIKKEDFKGSFDYYIDRDENDLTSNYSIGDYKGKHLTTITNNETKSTNEKREEDNHSNTNLKKEDSKSETTTETDIETDIDTDI